MNRHEHPSLLRADLHSHSNCSDGVLSPSALVERAAAQGVELLAITDHDTTAGVADARAAAERLGLRLIAGVEISVSWKGQVLHVLGLNIDPGHPELSAGLQRLERVRIERAERMAAKLERAGVAGALAGAQAQAGDTVPGRNHFARYLVETGHARDLQRAFKRYLVRGASCYVACQWATLEEALAWIAAAGGQGVLAHPARYRMSRSALRRTLEAFSAAGGVGMEIISGNQTPEVTAALAAHAHALGLLASRGSDFHEPGAGPELGRLAPLPAGCTPVWLDWAA
ncbi:MAG: PHP domain-containing protein [Gammaproteobacteria bacterium]|nr:PHP domain-containing protein [Gammaproteobacteria bacterium]